MSTYNIGAMQASGMTTQQINDFIKKAEANAPKMLQDFKSQIDPQKVVAGVQTPVKQPVKPQVMPSVKPRINQNKLQKAYDDVYRQTSGTNKPQVMPPVKPQSVSGKNLYEGRIDPYEKFARKGSLGGINPNVKPPAGIDVEKIRQGLQSLPKAQQGDDFVSKQQSNVPFAQRVQSLQRLGQNNASMMKKGGEAKKYTKGGKINLDACGVSTAQKSKSSPKW